MQIGNIGAGHNEDAHHITNNFHHRHQGGSHTKGAAAASQSAFGAKAGASQQGGFSLSAWLADPFKSIKTMFGKVWNGGSGGTAEGTGGKSLSGQEQLLIQATRPAHNAVLHSAQTAAVSTVLQPQKIGENPYFMAVEETENARPTFLQRVRARAQSASGRLTKHFSFTGKNFQAKQEQPKENLRKRSRYREDDLDIECVLTDDSYLLDSYDRSGQYSQLSTKK